MTAFRSALWIGAMTIGLATTGCQNNNNAAPASGDTSATSSETDTVDETAPAASAPPAPEAENPGAPPVPGQVWCPGSWRWERTKYVWGRGHWEAGRPGFSYHPARWVEAGGKWEHHPGHWNSDKPGVGHPAHTDAHPPAPVRTEPAKREQGEHPEPHR